MHECHPKSPSLASVTIGNDLAISDHLQPEQGQECQDPRIEIGNKGIARESLAVTDYSSSCGMHLDPRLRGTERGQQHTNYCFVMLRLHDFFQVWASRNESLSCNFDANERRRRVLRCPLMSTSHFTRVLMHRYNSDLHSLLSIT